MTKRAENYQAMLPTLSTWHWRKHTHLGRPALKHKSGSVCVFAGPDAVKHRNETLRLLNRYPRPKLDLVSVGTSWMLDDQDRPKFGPRKKKFRHIVRRA